MLVTLASITVISKGHAMQQEAGLLVPPLGCCEPGVVYHLSQRAMEEMAVCWRKQEAGAGRRAESCERAGEELTFLQKHGTAGKGSQVPETTGRTLLRSKATKEVVPWLS